MLYEVMSRPKWNKSEKTWTFPVGQEYKATYTPTGNRLIVECSDQVSIEQNGSPVLVQLNDAGYYESTVVPGVPCNIVVNSVRCTSLAAADIEVDEYNAQYFFQYRNTSGELLHVTLYSATDAKVFVNREKYDGSIAAGGELTLSLNSGDVVRTVGQTCQGLPTKPLIKVQENTSGLVVDKMDESVASLACAFYGCTALTELPSNMTLFATNLNEAFSGCTNLASIPSSFEWLSMATSMQRIFYGCSNIVNGGSEGFSFLSKITDCQEAFSGCSKWKGKAFDLYSYLSTKTTQVTASLNCFSGCSVATGHAYIPTEWGGLGEERQTFEFKNVGTESISLSLFTDGETSVYIDGSPLGTYNTSEATGAEIAVTLEPGSKCNVLGLHRNRSLYYNGDYTDLMDDGTIIYRSRPATMMAAQADEGCIEITKFDNAWLTMHSAFINCTALKKVPDRWRAVSDNETLRYNIRSVFQGCTNLENIPMSFSGIYAGHDSMSMAFRDCTSIKHAPSDWTSLAGYPSDSVTFFMDRSLDAMFSGCTSLEDGILPDDVVHSTTLTGGIDHLEMDDIYEWSVFEGSINGKMTNVRLMIGTPMPSVSEMERGTVILYYDENYDYDLSKIYVYGSAGETLYVTSCTENKIIRDFSITGVRGFMQGCTAWKGPNHILGRILEDSSTAGYYGSAMSDSIGALYNAGGLTQGYYSSMYQQVIIDMIPKWWAYSSGGQEESYTHDVSDLLVNPGGYDD